jgi:hypothetical protein
MGADEKFENSCPLFTFYLFWRISLLLDKIEESSTWEKKIRTCHASAIVLERITSRI